MRVDTRAAGSPRSTTPKSDRRPLVAVAVAALALAAGACAHGGGSGTGGPEPGGISGSGVGYVDMDSLLAEHPLHGQLQAMQDQISVLQQESSLVPTGMSPQQTAAYGQMQAELGAQSQKFQQDMSQRRDFYQRREAETVNRLQAAALGSHPDEGGVLSGLQQQFASQAQAIQKQAFATFNNYRTELFRQDSEHLKHVQGLLASEMRGKLAQRESALSAQETAYQVALVKADQGQRLNLQAKLQNLALSDSDRKHDQDELSAINAREQSKINAVKARDNAELTKLQHDLNAQAASSYDVERARTQAATQAKLAARQKEMQSAMAPRMQALSGKFQQQLNTVNARLAGDEKYKTQVQAIHAQTASAYGAEAEKATASYRQVRAALVEKYSAIAHMRFQDNETIAAQADKLASDRRDLFQKITVQLQAQVQQVARQAGVAVVFDSIRGAGTAIDLTDRVRKAVNSSGGPTGTPATSTPGGS